MVRTMVRREYYGQLRSFFSEVSNFEGSRSKKKKKKKDQYWKGPILGVTRIWQESYNFVRNRT